MVSHTHKKMRSMHCVVGESSLKGLVGNGPEGTSSELGHNEFWYNIRISFEAKSKSMPTIRTQCQKEENRFENL